MWPLAWVGWFDVDVVNKIKSVNLELLKPMSLIKIEKGLFAVNSILYFGGHEKLVIAQ